MKKITSLFLVWFMSLSLVMAIPGFAGINDRDSDINLTKGNVVELPQISAPSGNPDSNEGWIYVKDSSGTTKLYFEDDAGTVHDLITASTATLDSAYDAGGSGAGRTVTVDQGALQLNGSHASNNTLFINKTAGSGHAIAITNAGTGYDINGTSDTWFIDKAGAATFSAITNSGTDAAAINLTATAGGITAVTATGKAITLNGTVNNKVGSNVASPAGGELDLGDGNYFYITGTNNITSIAAADATSGRMIVLRFAGILTFTDGNNLKLAGNFATTADDTITLICDGTNCYEMARSAN